MEKVNFHEKLALFSDYWAPKVVGALNENLVKVAKFKGKFTWHKHDDADELFFVIKGTLLIKLRDRDITVFPGEMFIVPKGVEHMPVAEEEVHCILIEPKTVLNTGDAAQSKLTCEHLDVL